jgi:hypothetical protein
VLWAVSARKRTIGPVGRAGGFKAGPWVIVSAHWRTYVDARGGTPRVRDWVEFGLPPLVAGGLSYYAHVKLSTAASAGLLTVSGLLGAFLFGVITQISNRAMDLAEEKPEPGSATTAHARNLGELAANAGYAGLVCITAAAVFVVASVSSHLWLRISSAVGLALAVHLGMTLLMVMRREFALTQERLSRVETGADRPERALRRRAG